MCAEHLQQAMDLFDKFYLKRRWVLSPPPPWSSDQGTQPLMEKKKGCEIAKSYIVCPLSEPASSQGEGEDS